MTAFTGQFEITILLPVESNIQFVQQQFPDRVGDIRNRGAMIAMELVQDGDAQRPDPVLTKSLVTAAADRGLILLSCGIRGNVIRFLPALTIPENLIDEGMDLVAKSLDDCVAQSSCA